MSELLPCPVCDFSGPYCLCTRPDPAIVLAHKNHWWNVVTALAAKAEKGFIRQQKKPRGWPWRQKRLINRQPFRPAEIAWLLHHGSWPAGYVEMTNGPSLGVADLVLHRHSPHLPRNRAGLPYTTQVHASGWEGLVSVPGRKAPLSLGRFKTPEEAHTAVLVLRPKLQAAVNPREVWTG
jgi:hypothetical protein